MKKIFQIILVLTISIVFYSCGENVDDKHKIYADSYKLYSKNDSTSLPVSVYIAYPGGHKTMYHVYSGKNKGSMEVWHMTQECAKCNKLTNKK